jgi:hypothetical protein
MSDMQKKKGKNFKEFIEEDKNRGKTTKKLMRFITSINSSAVYGGSFLAVFLILDVSLYLLFNPGVLIWAGILVATALASSLIASRITNVLKKNQWRYRT